MTNFDPTQSQRDPSKPWFQKRPLSLRSSGTELDEGCELSDAGFTDDSEPVSPSETAQMEPAEEQS